MSTAANAVTGREYASLADIGQYEEEIIEGYRGELDANAALPPLPHDVYACRVKYAEFWPSKDGMEPEALAADPGRRWEKRIAKDGKVFYMTWITYTTENNKDTAHDGRERQEVITTYPTKRGITGVQALLQGLGVDTIALNSHQMQMKALDDVIAGEGGMAGIELDWEATVYDKEAIQRDPKTKQPIIDPNTNEPKKGVELFSLKGMKKFPKDGDGNYVAELDSSSGHTYKNADGVLTAVTEARARNFMRRWVPVSKLSGGAAVEQVAVNAAAAPAVAPTRAAAPAARPAAPAAPVSGRPAVRRVTS